MSVLVPKSYDGVAITFGGATYSSGFPDDGTIQMPPEWDQREVAVAGSWPVALSPQPRSRTFALWVQITATLNDASIQAFKALFDPRKGERILIATDGTTDWQIACSVLRAVHDPGNMGSWTAILKATLGLWRKVTESTASATLTFIPLSMTPTNAGNQPTPIAIDATPTAVHGQTHDYIYRMQVVVANRAPRALRQYPVRLIINTAAEVAAGRMLASNDDLRVLVDGVEVNRWLVSPNNATTAIWFVADWAPARTFVLGQAITAGSPATGSDVAPDADLSQVPASGEFLLGTELIAYEGNDGTTLRNITRGVRGTTAASHAAGDVAYFVEHQVDLIYGYSAAGSPPTDIAHKPMLQLAFSDNDTWSFTQFATEAGTRPLEWSPEYQLANDALVSARGEVVSTNCLPTGAGHVTAGTVVGAATAWQAVDDPVGAPDDDTTYNQLSAPGQVTMFVSSTIPTVPKGALVRLQIHTRHRADVGGQVIGQLLLRVRGVDFGLLNGFLAATASYVSSTLTFPTSPLTGQPWTAEEVAALQFGYELTLMGTATWWRVTQCYVTVSVVEDDDPADAVGIYAQQPGGTTGHPVADTWTLRVPTGVFGAYSIDGNATAGLVDDVAVEIIGEDEFGTQRVLANFGTSFVAGGAWPLAANPNTPMYKVGIRVNTAVADALAGWALNDVVLLLDPDAVPVTVIGARESLYLHRWSITNATPTPDRALSILAWPGALNKTLTVDTETGLVTYEDAGYHPLSAVALDAPRLNWFDLEAGVNALTFTDTILASGSLDVALRYRDRRS